MEKEKPIWKQWDEALIDAWEKEEKMFITAFSFLRKHVEGITYEKFRDSDPKEFFFAIGVTLRSPKIKNHIFCGSARAFFNQFFPNANELLWQGKKLAALKTLRTYRVAEERLRGDRELEALQKDASRKKSTSKDFQLIPGTNAMHVSEARRSTSDWNIVKPSGRQRKSRL